MDRETLENFRCYVNLKNQEETSETLADWLDFMATIRIDTGGNNWVKMSSNTYSGQKYSNKPSRSSSNYAIKTTENCPIECPEKHQLVTCPKFKSMTIHDRWRIVRKQKRCRKCFSTHHTDKCDQANNCDKCDEQHNTLLHIDGYYKGSLNPHARPFSNDTTTANGTNQSLMVHDRRINCVSTQCPVQKILVNDAHNNKKKAVIFQDSGSDICLMRKEYAKKLGLRGKEITLNMLLAGGERRVDLSEILTVTVSPFEDTEVEK
ncbi:hypothetical protein SNE40_009539 [Patella caerulea]|uniref:Peptidase aspartic putative domain-containing protein n=1 Tax=Patella caerulea TaxID=87958 RepID=A0AAN8JZ90_PATCE